MKEIKLYKSKFSVCGVFQWEEIKELQVFCILILKVDTHAGLDKRECR
jgi:hypothetical protein